MWGFYHFVLPAYAGMIPEADEGVTGGGDVLPAYAGMILVGRGLPPAHAACSPRMRG